MKRVFFGFLWAVVFYTGACFLAGMVLGFSMAGSIFTI